MTLVEFCRIDTKIEFIADTTVDFVISISERISREEIFLLLFSKFGKEIVWKGFDVEIVKKDLLNLVI